MSAIFPFLFIVKCFYFGTCYLSYFSVFGGGSSFQTNFESSLRSLALKVFNFGLLSLFNF